MTEKEKKNKSGEISRREFLKDAGLVAGGAAIGSTVLLAACGGGDRAAVTETATKTATKTVTQTAGEVTKTITTTQQVGTATVTETQSVSKFVCPVCDTEFDILSGLQNHFEAEHAGEAPTALNVINFTVNGEAHELQVEPEWTLQHLIHDRMGWTGIKDMCTGFGACGSCTVIMDGKPILSCMMLAIECDGTIIETAEGIAKMNHPLIEAYIRNHCMQCGYCTPGFVVTAKALLDRNSNPTDEEIKEALAGNLCRCSTYPLFSQAYL